MRKRRNTHDLFNILHIKYIEIAYNLSMVIIECGVLTRLHSILLYSTRNFICRGHFPVFLIEILLKIEFQWQFWILLVLRILKHPQKVEFDKDLAELLKVKHNTSHMKNFQLF